MKFKDADLVGIPYRITIGKKLSEGLVEWMDRRSRLVEEIAPESAAAHLKAKSSAARF